MLRGNAAVVLMSDRDVIVPVDARGLAHASVPLLWLVMPGSYAAEYPDVWHGLLHHSASDGVTVAEVHATLVHLLTQRARPPRAASTVRLPLREQIAINGASLFQRALKPRKQYGNATACDALFRQGCDASAPPNADIATCPCGWEETCPATALLVGTPPPAVVMATPTLVPHVGLTLPHNGDAVFDALVDNITRVIMHRKADDHFDR